ncbi:hypothetical protein AAEP93_002537 [Penicillium crustosum]
MAQFNQYNPEIKNDCSGLLVNHYVCVSIIGVDPNPTTTATTAAIGIVTPTPTRAGMVGNCDTFYKVKSGDDCGEIATSCGISTEQLSKWNTDIGSTCSGLWPDYYICVGAVNVDAKPTTTTKDNEMATPTPTQSGMVGTCNTFYRVGSDDTCERIAKAAGITLANFYDWNKGVGSDCGSLWLLYYVCIGVR